MKKWHNVAIEDNRFATWSAEQLWDHFTAQVLGHTGAIGTDQQYHTWLKMIHRADAIPKEKTQADIQRLKQQRAQLYRHNGQPKEIRSIEDAITDLQWQLKHHYTVLK